MSLHLDFNDTFRAVVVGALGAAPEVGGLISKVTASLWPNAPKDQQPLTQLKAFVNLMLSGLLDNVVVDSLQNSIDGLHTGLDAYARATSGREEKFKAVMFTTDMIRGKFLESPWATLTYLVTFGTIRLGLLREEYLFYQAIYGFENPSPPATLSYLKVC